MEKKIKKAYQVNPNYDYRSLVEKYPDYVPNYTGGAFDDRATGGAMQNWRRFGTDRNNITAGYGYSPSNGNYLFGDLYMRDSNLPTVSKSFDTPFGSLDIDTNYDGNPGISATYNIDDRLMSLYNKLVDNYKKNQEFLNNRQTPAEKIINNLPLMY